MRPVATSAIAPSSAMPVRSSASPGISPRIIPSVDEDEDADDDRVQPAQYRQLLRSAPGGAVFSIRSTALGMNIW